MVIKNSFDINKKNIYSPSLTKKLNKKGKNVHTGVSNKEKSEPKLTNKNKNKNKHQKQRSYNETCELCCRWINSSGDDKYSFVRSVN